MKKTIEKFLLAATIIFTFIVIIGVLIEPKQYEPFLFILFYFGLVEYFLVKLYEKERK